MSVRATLIRPLVPILFKRALTQGVPVAELRRRLDRRGRLVPHPRDVRWQRTTLGGRPATHCRPRHADPARRLMHIHGGAHVMGSWASHGALTGRLAQACASDAWLPDYPLAPEHPYPAGAEAVVAAYADLRAQSDADIVITGDSSGAAVLLAALTMLRDRGQDLPACAVMLSPWLDLAVDGPSVRSNAQAEVFIDTDWLRAMGVLYAGGADVATISPLDLDLTGLPPIHVQVSADEVLLSDAERLAGRARECEVECTVDVWPGVWHAWHTNAPFLPEANEAIRSVGRVVDGHARRSR